VPITYEVDPGAALIRVEASGDVLPRDIFQHLDRLAADPAIGPGVPALVDVRGITRVPTAAEFRTAGQAYGAAGRGRFASSRRAFLVDGMLMFGAVRQLAAAAEPFGVDVRPFLDEGEALAWLGEVARP
jgi:hypothetical protein